MEALGEEVPVVVAVPTRATATQRIDINAGDFWYVQNTQRSLLISIYGTKNPPTARMTSNNVPYPRAQNSTRLAAATPNPLSLIQAPAAAAPPDPSSSSTNAFTNDRENMNISTGFYLMPRQHHPHQYHRYPSVSFACELNVGIIK